MPALASSTNHGPNMFGWMADGAAVSGVRLQARCLLGVAVASAMAKMAMPEVLVPWTLMFSHVRVSAATFKTKPAQAINMWRETVVNAKINETLNPIAMVRSLCALGLDVEATVKGFEAQMTVVDPALRPQGRSKQRLASFMDPSKLPATHFSHLSDYWSRPGLSYESCAYNDGIFDLPGFWVGGVALDSRNPCWVRLGRTTVASQLTHMTWAEVAHERTGRLPVDRMRKKIAVAALVHNFVESGLALKRLDVGAVEDFTDGLRSEPDGAVINETAEILQHLPDVDSERR